MKSQTDQPVSSELRANLLDPFVEAARVTFSQMAQIDLNLVGMCERTDFRTTGDVSAVVGLVSPAEGSLVLSFSERAAQMLANRVLADVGIEPDDNLIRDCVGEVANVVAGQAKGALAGTPYYFVYAPPTVVAGRGHEVRHRPGVPCLVIEFASSAGEIQLQLSVSASSEASET